MKFRKWQAALAICGAVAGIEAANASAATPDAAETPQSSLATLTTADLAAPDKELGDERKYWVLHKPGMTAAQVSADLSFCWNFVPHGVQRTMPSFVPWQKGDATRTVTYDGGQYGLVGMAIGAMIAGPLERSVRQSRMFRCMVPRGYARYRISEDMWKRIYQAPREEAIATLSRIASGPTPPNPQVLP